MPELKESIALCCKQLRLSSNLAERAMTQEGETNQQYLYNLLANEVQYRRERRLKGSLSSPCWSRIITGPERTSSCMEALGQVRPCCLP